MEVMTMRALMNNVIFLARKEKNRADRQYGPIRSDHEGYGVLAEEIQELQDEVSIFTEKYAMECILRAIRDGDHAEMEAGLQVLGQKALHAAAEAIQIAAVCERYMELVTEEANEDGNDLEGKQQ